jgi:hypothetical protein
MFEDMQEYEITGINKPHHQSPFEHITHIGNIAGKWRLTRESAIARISGGNERFYTIDHTTGRHIDLEVVANDGGKAPYLKTRPDGKWRDNLLALPECGPECRTIS